MATILERARPGEGGLDSAATEEEVTAVIERRQEGHVTVLQLHHGKASALDLETRILPTLAVRIRSARELNERLHVLLLRALALEVGGVVLAAIAVVVLLTAATDAASAVWPLVAGLAVAVAVVFAVLAWRGRPFTRD